MRSAFLKRQILPVLLTASSLVISLVVLGNIAVQDPQQQFAAAKKAFENKNFNDAIPLFRAVVENSGSESEWVVESLEKSLNCFRQIGTEAKLDALLQDAVSIHDQSPAVFAAAANSLLSASPYGVIVDGEFLRGNNARRRVSGSFINCAEQDRNQSLRWLVKGLSIVPDNNPVLQGKIRLQLADTLLRNRGGQLAWRLQSKTDFSRTLSYTDQDQQSSYSSTAAPVDAEGNPLLYARPESLTTSTSDGQRLRWALDSSTLPSSLADDATLRWARFLESQFSVQTLNQYSWMRNSTDRTDEDANDSILSLHTLSDSETSAKLAIGVKRFSLPEEHHFIHQYRQLLGSKHSNKLSAAISLVEIYLNRRQFEKAAELIRQHPDLTQLRRRLSDIVDPRITFDAIRPQPSGSPVELSFVFRNAERLQFEAQKVDLERLIQEVQSHYSNLSSTNRFFQNRQRASVPNLAYPRSLFQEERIADYTTGTKQSWEEVVQPRAKHWDKRQQTNTPLTDAGLYVVDVKASSSASQSQHTARILVWVSEHAILQKPLASEQLFSAVRTQDGKPITDGMLEFFGWRWDKNHQATVTKRLAVNLGQSGEAAQALDSSFQWLTILRVPNSPPTLLNFRGFYSSGGKQTSPRSGKAYGVCSQPIYRPGNQAKIKFWCAYTTYGDVEAPRIANADLEARILGPRGTEVFKQRVRTDAYGSFEIEPKLSQAAKLGYYRCEIRRPNIPKNPQPESRIRTRMVPGTSQSWPSRFECSTGFLVEEFRKPEFEVEILAPETPIALGQTVTAKVQAKYYIGTPVSGAKAKVQVTRSEYVDSFYPAQPFDWCYGPGYWWYAEPCVWHPTWKNWRGCLTPSFGWYRPRGYSPPELVAEMEVELDAKGQASVEIDTQLAKDLFGEQSQSYSISATVTDLSRRSVVAQGTVIAAAKPFKIYTWVDKGFYQTDEEITASFQARTLDGNPVAGSGTAELLRVELDANNRIRETTVGSVRIDSGADGNGDARFRASQPGQYRLKIEIEDSEGVRIEGAYVFYVRGRGDETAQARFADLELTPELKQYAPGDTVKLQIASGREDGHVLLFVRPESGVYSRPQHIALNNHTAVVEIPVREVDAPNFFVEAVTVFGGEVHSKTCQIVVPPESKIIQTTVESDKKVYEPGEEASFTIETKDKDGKPVAASVLLACYDRSLESIAANALPGDIRAFFWKWQRRHHPQTAHSLAVGSYPIRVTKIPPWTTLGIFGNTVADNRIANEAFGRGGPFGGGGAGGMYGGGSPEPMAIASGVMMESADAFGATAKAARRSSQLGVPQPNQMPAVRRNFADSIVWFSTTTDSVRGQATTKVKLPDNLTGWRVGSWGVGSRAAVGSAQSEITTKKSFFVRLQTPRFLVERDEAILSAIIHNDTDQALDIDLRLAIDGETQLELLSDSTVTVNVNPFEKRRVDFRCKAVASGNVGLRVEAKGQSQSGTGPFSDALQQSLGIVPYGSQTQDAWAGTMLDKEDQSVIELEIPVERSVDQSTLTIRMTPSLAFAMVESLPYLAEYPYGCTEQTLNRFLPAIQTKSALERLGISLREIEESTVSLNPQELTSNQDALAPNSIFSRTPLASEEKLKEMVDVGVRKLTDFQNQDGGWGWFPGTSSRSNAHTTALVLRGLMQAKDLNVAIVPSVLTRGQQWLVQYQDKQVTALQNWDTEQLPRKRFADNTDAFVFNVLVQLGVKNTDMLNALYRDRGKLSCYGKSLVGAACLRLGDQSKYVMLRKNIEQFLVIDDENQTAFLSEPGPTWYWYGSEIESNATFLNLVVTHDPNDPLAPKLIKYLLNNRRHATYWNSTRDTAIVIDSFTNYLERTNEAQQSSVVDVLLGDKRLGRFTFAPGDLLTGNNTIQLSGNAIPAGSARLTMKRVQGGGNLYWNVYSSNYSREDQIKPTGLEVRVERKYWLLKPKVGELEVAGQKGQALTSDLLGFDRVEVKDLADVNSGEQVEVELILKSKNDYEYLLVEDKKPAGFESVSQNSGYFYSGGLLIYRELRNEYVGLCIERLNRGEYSLKYRLRAESPGSYNALPAVIEGMYSPELFGNSTNQVIRISDAADTD